MARTEADGQQGASAGMAFGCVIPHTDTHVCVEGTHRYGAGGLQRISDSKTRSSVRQLTGIKALLQLTRMAGLELDAARGLHRAISHDPLSLDAAPDAFIY